jgi:hypothetical protein
LTLSGTVTSVDWTEPHVTRKGWSKDTLKLGEVITVKGCLAKSEPFTAAARAVEMPDRKQLSSADDDDGGPKH